MVYAAQYDFRPRLFIHPSIPPTNFLTFLSFSSPIILWMSEQFHGLCTMELKAQLVHSP